MQLDMKDRRILHALDTDSTQSYNQIANDVALSKEGVRYRIKRLQEHDVINKCFTIIDPAKLGYTFHKLLLRLQNVDGEKRSALFNHLHDQESVAWLVDLEGPADIGCVIAATNTYDVHRFLEDLYRNFSAAINHYDLSANIYGDYLPRSYLLDEQTSDELGEYSAAITRRETDSRDKTILRALTRDARTSATTIARNSDMSVDTVLERKRRLEHDDVIQGYTFVLNNRRVDQLHYKVLLYLSKLDKDRVRALMHHCRSHDRITYVIRALGDWQYELDLEVTGLEQFRTIMMEITTEFSSMIQDYTALVIHDIKKYDLYPFKQKE